MTFYEHDSHFAGRPVVVWEPGKPLPADLAGTTVHIRYDYQGDTWLEQFAEYLRQPGIEDTTALSVGLWADGFEEAPTDEVAALIEAAPRLANLRALFFGHITMEECEVSWITSTDLGPLLAAYPALEEVKIRGGNELRLSALSSNALTRLTIQSGGLSQDTVRDVADAGLPKLTHLELYLGTEDYGAGYSLADLAPILNGRFPELTYLGLKNSQMQDDVARATARCAALSGLKTLDLSLGVLTDDGGQALLDAPGIAALEVLDLRHNWLSDQMVARLQTLPPQVLTDRLDADQDDPDWRYVAIGE